MGRVGLDRVTQNGPPTDNSGLASLACSAKARRSSSKDWTEQTPLLDVVASMIQLVASSHFLDTSDSSGNSACLRRQHTTIHQRCLPTMLLLLCPYSGAKYCDNRVCVCLSAREYISGNTRSIFTIFVHVTHCCGSVLLWRCRDTLCTSDFIDDVILAHKPKQLNVAAQLIEAQPTCSLRLGLNRRVGIPVAGQWTHTYGPTFRAPRSWPTRLQWVC